MRDIDDFLTLVLPNAPAAPEPTILRHIREAAATFCRRTRLWREVDVIAMSGRPEPISVPPDSVLVEITACSLDGRPLEPISLVELARLRPDWRQDGCNQDGCNQQVGNGGARWYVAPEFGTIQVVPRNAGVATVEFVAMPSVMAATLPDFLFDLYGSVIGDGASAGVLLTPDAAFGNPDLGAVLAARFEQALGGLCNAGRRGQQRAPTRTRGRYL